MAASALIHQPLPQRLNIPFDLNEESPQARGLVAWLPMVGANDRSVQNYAGARRPLVTTAGPVLVTDATIGRMLTFNGITQFANTSVRALPTFQETTPFSASFWVRSTDTSGSIVGNWLAGTNPGWVAEINSGAYRLLLSDAMATAGRMARTTATTFGDGLLHHVVVTYAGNSSSAGILIYVDGVAQPMTSLVSSPPGTLVDIGFVVGSGPNPLAGSVGDIRVYDRVLSAQEVARMYAPQTRWELYKPLVWTSYRRPAGVAHTATLSGTLTPAGALVERPAKVLAGTLTPAGAVIKAPRKGLAGTLTPAGAILKSTSKSFGGTLTPAATLAAIKATLLTLSGTLTPAGALVKQAQKLLAGTLTPAGALTRAASKAFGGTLTPAGALSTSANEEITLAGTLTPTAAVVNLTSKIFTGTLTPTGVVVKSTSKTLVGTLTPAGALTAIKAILLTLAGTLTPAGALLKQAQKTLAGTLTPAAALVKATSRSLTGSLTPAGLLTKLTTKTLQGTVTPTAALLRQAGKSLSGVLTPAAGLIRSIGKFLSGLLSPTGTLTTSGGTPVIHHPVHSSRTVTVTLLMTDVLAVPLSEPSPAPLTGQTVTAGLLRAIVHTEPGG